MKRILAGVLACLLSLSNYAQDLDFEWAKSLGSWSSDYGRSITTDTLGNSYVTGYYMGTVDFNPSAAVFNLTSNGSYDIFIQKLDVNGIFVWARSIGGLGSDEAYSVTTDASNNLYITGTFKDTVDFDPDTTIYNLISKGLTDVFVLKLDALGKFIWVKSFGSASADYATSINVDAFGNIYTLGYYYGTVDFDPSSSTFNLTSNGLWDIFIQKLDTVGNFIWAKSIGGTSNDQGLYITTSASGNIYVTGSYKGTADFDPDTSNFNMISKGGVDAFILKLGGGGDFIWAKSMGGSLVDIGRGISTDSLENICIIGNYQGTVDFNPNSPIYNLTSVNASDDFFILKLDDSGSFIYAKSIGGASGDVAYSITTDASNNIYITGTYTGTVDFNPDTATYNITSNNANFDVFILKLDTLGGFLWAKSVGGLNGDVGYSIAHNTSEEIFVTGIFQNPFADFDPDTSTFILTSIAGGDVFILKLSECGSKTSTDVISTCDSIMWIDGNTYTESNFSATHVIKLINGCDSIVTLNLTISPFSSTDVVTACGSYKWIDGITYMSSNDSATYTFKLSNRCDSVITLNLTINNVDASVNTNDELIYANEYNANYQWLDCGKNYAVIPNQLSQSFTPLVSGEYAVKVTKNGCTDTSECVSFTIVGLEKIFFKEVSVFPNPNSGIVNIDFGDLIDVSIKVFNNNSEIIYRKDKIIGVSHQFELNTASGYYTIEISSQGKKQRYGLILSNN